MLNDTSSICLGTGKRILINHFNICRKYNGNVTHGQTISIQKAFPDNINQIRRIRFNWGAYDIVIFSYVVQPLNEDKGVRALVQGLSDTEQLCNDSGRILILQDKFQTALVGQISRAIGISRHEDELTQQVFPKRNTSETCTYSYYSCLYSPATVVKAKKDCVA